MWKKLWNDKCQRFAYIYPENCTHEASKSVCSLSFFEVIFITISQAIAHPTMRTTYVPRLKYQK